MSRVIFLALALVFCFLFAQPTASFGADTNMDINKPATKIRITSGSQEAVIALYDNPASGDFVSLLPLTVTFEDYAKTEKITYLPRKLAVKGGVTAGEIVGDFAYYAPWGNLAVFYDGFGKGAGLYILGRIESGKDWLTDRRQNFTARIEVMPE